MVNHQMRDTPEDTASKLLAALTAATNEARELMRELHGMTKDAERAKKTLDDAIQTASHDIHRQVTRAIQDTVDKHARDADAAFAEFTANISRAIEKSVDNIQLRAAELAGLKTPEEFMQEIMDGLQDSLTETLTPVFIAQLQDWLESEPTRTVVQHKKRGTRRS